MCIYFSVIYELVNKFIPGLDRSLRAIVSTYSGGVTDGFSSQRVRDVNSLVQIHTDHLQMGENAPESYPWIRRPSCITSADD